MDEQENDWKIIESSGYRLQGRKVPVVYQLLSNDAVDTAAELYAEVFLNDEPMTCRHRIDPVDFLPYAREYLRFCADQQLSFIAVEQETHEIAGFALGSDLSTEWESVGPGIITLLSFFRESMVILGEVEHKCVELREIQIGTVFHIFQLGVRREFRGNGIATGLIHCILAHAKRRGFGKVVVDCTGPVSRHTCERCGFVETAYIAYDDFHIDGKAFFHGIPGGISLMIREI